MNIHICGAHRTGKSSLGFTLESALPWLTFKPTYIFEFLSTKYGIKDIKQLSYLPLMMRLRIQEDILTQIAMINLDDGVIIDRTFFDVMAYSLFTGIPETDFGADHVSFLTEFYTHIEKNTIFVLTTPIEISDSVKRLDKSASWESQSHINKIIQELLVKHNPRYLIHAPVASVDQRATFVASKVEEILK